MSEEAIPPVEFLEAASERIFAKLAEHPEPGVRAINALTGPLPLDNESVIAVARSMQAKAQRG